MNTSKQLIKDYFDKHSLVESNIESYNNFIEKGVQEIVNETQEIIPTIIPAEVKEIVGEVKSSFLFNFLFMRNKNQKNRALNEYPQQRIQTE